MVSIHLFESALTLLIIFNVSRTEGQLQKKGMQYVWQEIGEWGDCSKSCGVGLQQKQIICIKKSIYSETMVDNKKCTNVPLKLPSTRECNFGECSSTFSWKPNKWSECSQTCGNSGKKAREIECVNDEGSGNLVTSDIKHCNQSLRPEATASCNILDCPLILIPGEWGKCMKGRKCAPGTQRRQMTCTSILKTGKPKAFPRHACSGNKKPPASWRKCYNYVNTGECKKYIQTSPVIETKSNTLVQMRKTKLLSITVGQLAYVLLYTKILIICPVNYFVPREIIWKHGSTTYKYQGKSKSHVRVDKNGRLRIKRLNASDQGTWSCIADSVNASAIIKIRNPSVGFQDWALRTTLWNKEMLNEDPQSGMIRNEIVQWIKNSWSACSVTCGGKGVQSRDVHCEQLDTRHYIILADDVCEKQGQKKPMTTRSCQMSTQCPKWILLDADRDKCTNKCLRIGFSQIQGQLQCVHRDKELDHSACNKKEMPDIECPNNECQVKWKISKWSKCSKSCGGDGIMARFLICVWQNTEDPSGSLCYDEKLPMPTVIKSCKTPKCNLKCIDLSKTCTSKKKFCNWPIYRYMCCETCSKLDTSPVSKGNHDPNKNMDFGNKNNVNKLQFISSIEKNVAVTYSPKKSNGNPYPKNTDSFNKTRESMSEDKNI